MLQSLDERIRRTMVYDGSVVRRSRDGRLVGHLDKHGYLKVSVNLGGKTHNLFVHRIAWFLHHGEWPRGQIDHVNRMKTDNRIENLRVVSAAANSSNRKSSDHPWGLMKTCNGGRSWYFQTTLAGVSVYRSGFASREAAMDEYRRLRASVT